MTPIKAFSMLFCLTLLIFCTASRAEDVVINIAEGGNETIEVKAGAGGFAVQPGSPWGWGNGQQGMYFEQFMSTLTQLNMTPELTLDRETKQKLQEVRDQWTAAQSKFMADNKDQFAKISLEQMEAFKGKDQEKIKAAMQKSQELYAKGPKSDEYIAKAKAALSPEQLKVVDAKIAKDEEQRKAMIEKWRASEKKEEKEAPGTPVKPKE